MPEEPGSAAAVEERAAEARAAAQETGASDNP
jgi:hypothetical protein